MSGHRRGVSGTLESWPPEESDPRRFKGREKGGGHHSRGPNERDTTTQHKQQHTTTQHRQQHPATHNNTPTPHNHPPTITTARVAVYAIPHHRPCLSSCLLIRLLSSASCLCFCFCLVLDVLPRCCPNARLSLCLDVRLFARMSVSVRLFVCL